MSTPASSAIPGARASGGYVHDVMFWSGSKDFVRRTVSFVHAGLQAQEPVMVVLPGARMHAVARALGRDAERVRFADMEALGSNPARIMAAWVEFLDECDGVPSRGVGEPLWTGRSDAEVAECQLHEALLNLAIGEQAPLWLRCPYDADALPAAVLELASTTHPWVADSDGGVHANDGYGGAQLGLEVFSAPLPERPEHAIVRDITPQTLRSVRELVRHAATACGVGEDRAADLGLATHELGVNTIVHGDGTGTLRLWRERGALICEVSDSGRVTDPLAGRLHPPDELAQGRGLWIVNQLCDLVQLRSAATGTTVRIHTWL